MPGSTPDSTQNQTTNQPSLAQQNAQQSTQQPQSNQQPQRAQEQPETEDSPPSGTTLASFSTPLTDNSQNRVSNIRTALKSIQGLVLKSGEEFSFNRTVGPRTPERGYKQAHMITNGQETNGCGGGVCQISSTLFNVTTKLSLPVTERHPHQVRVKYIAEGKDAAVMYDSQDFRFRNNRPYPIKITGYLKDNRLTMVISVA